MSRSKLPEEPHRFLEFLAALEQPNVRRALETSGLDAKTIDEGWAILRRYTATRFAPVTETSAARRTTELDAWENRWVPVIRAVLRTRYPGVEAAFGRRLKQTSGNSLMITVPALVAALRELGKAPKGSEEAAARAHLARRGLTEAVLKEADGLTEHRIDDAPADGAPHADQAEAAATELHNWYVEWSEISRACITDARLLRVLGFGKPGRPRKVPGKRAATAAASKRKGARAAKAKRRKG